MVYVVLGALAITIVHFCDPVAIRRLPLLKPLIWAIGVGLATYAIVMACLWPDKLAFPAWMSWLGWLLLAISLILVVYSLFISLPFHKTYIAKGVGDKLITTGFYSLTRHPGVLWTVLLLGALILVSRSRLIFISTPLMILLDIVLVTIQDYAFFGRMFPGYGRYRKETPMLIPNLKSIKVFFSSMRRVGQPTQKQGEGKNVELI